MTDRVAPFRAPHDHVFLGSNQKRNERRTWLVIALTVTMMVVEITAGTIFGSMALVADGWHMATHAAALSITALAYRYARRNAGNPNFTFGTGRIGDLAGFASAVVLALVAVLIAWESSLRLVNPVTISFPQAIAVAVVGLVVNLVSAWLLREDHAHHHHGHHHHHKDHGHARDNNLRAAYLHVLADALTSLLAIFALILGSLYGWIWMDPLMGIVGSLVIARWSWGLMRDSGRVLVNYDSANAGLQSDIREAIESEEDSIVDLHVWQLGPGRHSAIISIRSSAPRALQDYRNKLTKIAGLSHLTIEVEATS